MADKVERSATVIPIGSVRIKDRIRQFVLVAGTDQEAGREALRDYAMQEGASSWTTQPIDTEGNPKGKASVFFSGDKWKAPWQPTGPKQPGGYIPPEKANPNEPIN